VLVKLSARTITFRCSMERMAVKGVKGIAYKREVVIRDYNARPWHLKLRYLETIELNPIPLIKSFGPVTKAFLHRCFPHLSKHSGKQDENTTLC
jgi:hypothetical protein